MRSCRTSKPGLFAHGDKVRRIDYRGKYFNSRGPFTVPRSEQGHPVVIQAGQSARGKKFAARWGELLFVGSPPTLDIGRRNYKQIKEAVAANGRDPNHVIIAPSAYVICGESKMEAEDKMALTEKLTPDIDALSLLSEAMNFRLRVQGNGRAIHGRRVGQHLRHAVDARPGSGGFRDQEPDDRGTLSNSAAAPARTSRLSAARRRSRTGWRNGSPPVFATGSC
jgi:alkanesulfonate monooxygenase SsuD/methylene tetrahydromethanopterin reductase-like flavin-dependent oxidoreductase (luciferase family)